MKSACSPAAIIGTVPCTLPYWFSHLVSLVQHVSLVRHVIFTPTLLLEYCKIQGETMTDGGYHATIATGAYHATIATSPLLLEMNISASMAREGHNQDIIIHYFNF
ncbi:hypothetical protein QQG55_28245 [Brugia pahangi]